MIKKIILILIIIAAILYILIVPISFEGFVTRESLDSIESPSLKIDTVSYKTEVEIIEIDKEDPSLGFNTDTSYISFGIMPLGSEGTRYLNISNLRDTKVKITFESTGNISDMVHFNSNEFILNPGETKDIIVSLKTTGSTEIGNYDGEIKISTIEPKNVLSETLLQWL